MEGLLSPLSDFFFIILKFVHENLGISWSWAIVILTIIVRVVLIPLTWRQIKSMRAMQALAPEVKALQEKYRDDKQVLNQKLMELYQKNRVSPFGSCLPLLLQLPVFLGLYYMLRTQGQPGGSFAFPNPTVSWIWIDDITKFDVLLMFLYIGSQFLASWQTARKGTAQQKTIAYLVPIVVGVFMFVGKWPAGLFIYWFTSNIWTIAQQFVAEKVMPVPVAVGAVPAGKAVSPAKSVSAGKEKTPAAQTVKKSGGKSSGQQTARQGKTPGGKGKRPDRRTGGAKGSGRT